MHLLLIYILTAATLSKFTEDDYKDYLDCMKDVDTKQKNHYPTEWTAKCMLQAAAGGSWTAQFAFAIVALIVQVAAIICFVLSLLMKEKKLLFTFAQWFYVLQCCAFVLTAIFWICSIITSSSLKSKFDEDDTDEDSRSNEDDTTAYDIYYDGRLRWFHIVVFAFAICAAVAAVLHILPLNLSFIKVFFIIATSCHAMVCWLIAIFNFGGPFKDDYYLEITRSQSYLGYAWTQFIMFTILYIMEVYLLVNDKESGSVSP